jgi:beta-glucanase (GH16 family)
VHSARGVSRRRFLGTAALGAAAAAGAAIYGTENLTASRSPTPRLLWSEEFDAPLDLVSAANPQGQWRTRDLGQATDQGYPDLGAGGNQCWLASPAQSLAGTTINPFAVQNSVLTIAAIRTPTDLLGEVQGCEWIGGALMTNTARADTTFRYGYYEIRARFPSPGRGMFPALWFYSAYQANTSAQSQAEIDLLEIFGNAGGSPWVTTLHERGSSGSGQQQAVSSRGDDTTQWHTYGLHWTASALQLYLDRRPVGTVTGAEASYFAECAMSIRLDYSMNATWFAPGNAADSSTPDRLTMEVDYVRKYDKPFS